MITKLRKMFISLPIVRILRRHHDERCEAECLRQHLKEEQHEVARRVHVIEWQTFPHTHKDTGRDDH